MQNITIPLQGEALPSPVKGAVLQIIGTDGAENLSVQFMQGSRVAYEVDGVGAGWRMKPSGGFDSLVFQADNAATISAIVTNGDIDIQILEVGSTITNAANNPVPVSLVSEPGAPVPVAVQGTVEVTGVELTATNVGINNTSANPVPVSLISEPGAPVAVSGEVTVSGGVNTTPTQATTITDAAPVAVAAFTSGAPNQVNVRAAGAARALRIANPKSSTGQLYVGGAGVTPTNAVIVLQPGDIWTETDAPQVAWYATSDTGATANIQVIA